MDSFKYTGTFKPLFPVYKLIELDNTTRKNEQTSYTYGYNDNQHHTYDWRGNIRK